MNKKIKGGVYPTMITPYTVDNKIDYNGVEQVLNWYAERGVDGIFAICQSSEIFFLSFEEKLELLKFIIAHKPEGVNIVASGHTADDLETQIEEAKHFIDCGIDAYVFISNRFAKPEESDEVLFHNMMTVCEALPNTDFGIYECPYPYKRLLTPELLKKMVQTDKFRFIKDTCCSLEQLQAKLDAVKGSDLMIFNANAATLLESLQMGCSGYSGVMANFHPELYSKLIQYKDTDIEKAQKLQNLLGFFSVAECQAYPINAKYYMTLDGLNINYTSRARSINDFPKNRQLEIDQMYALTKQIECLF